eukprot:5626751-Pyramimonas_sp.AAC.2
MCIRDRLRPTWRPFQQPYRIEPDVSSDVQDMWLEPWDPGWIQHARAEFSFFHAILDGQPPPDAEYWLDSRVLGAIWRAKRRICRL